MFEIHADPFVQGWQLLMRNWKFYLFPMFIFSSMAWCKRDVTPVRMHWSYASFASSHQVYLSWRTHNFFRWNSNTVGSDNGFVLNRWQDIICTNDDLICWSIHESLGLNDFIFLWAIPEEQNTWNSCPNHQTSLQNLQHLHDLCSDKNVIATSYNTHWMTLHISSPQIYQICYYFSFMPKMCYSDIRHVSGCTLCWDLW